AVKGLSPEALPLVQQLHYSARLGGRGVHHVGAVNPGVAGKNPLYATLRNGDSSCGHPANLPQPSGARGPFTPEAEGGSSVLGALRGLRPCSCRRNIGWDTMDDEKSSPIRSMYWRYPRRAGNFAQ